MNKKLIFIAATILALVVFLVGPTAVAAQPSAMVKVLIGFDRQPGSSEEGIVRGVGGTIKYTYHLVPAIAASIPEAAIEGLLKNPNVTRVELDIDVYAVDAELDNSWGVKHIGAGVVHASNKGTGIKVAVIDTGIDWNHPDLNANYKGGYDFVNKDSDPMDDNGHGTHVAGIVAAVDNGIGVVGVAPEVALYALKVLGADGSGSYSDVVAALQWAVNNKIQVTNNSYGSSGDPGVTVKAAFNNAYTAGVLHVAAAGNAGNPLGKGDNVIYPARWASVIAVAATNQSDTRASWSSTGPAVELAAPGVDVYSTYWDDTYKTLSGTSMASPHVAGTAALVMVAYPGWTNVQVRSQLQSTADDLGAVGKDNLYGYGLVNAYKAVPPPLATGSIKGTVTDGTNPIAGASVTDGTRTAITDINGIYEINNVPAGSYTVTASANNYKSASQLGVTVLSGVATTVNFTLTKILNGAITGKVTIAGTTSPIVGALVTNGTKTATTDGSGSYTILDVAPGTYAVSASATGYQSSTQSVTVVENTTSTANFNLSPVTQATTVSVKSISHSTEGGKNGTAHLIIIATLADNLGNPVAGAAVNINIDLNGVFYKTFTGTTATDGKVSFKINNAPSGAYKVTVTNVSASGLVWDGVKTEYTFTK